MTIFYYRRVTKFCIVTKIQWHRSTGAWGLVINPWSLLLEQPVATCAGGPEKQPGSAAHKPSLGLVPQFLGSAAEEGQSSPGLCFTHLHKQQSKWHTLILFWGFPYSQHLIHILTPHRKLQKGQDVHCTAELGAKHNTPTWGGLQEFCPLPFHDDQRTRNIR